MGLIILLIGLNEMVTVAIIIIKAWYDEDDRNDRKLEVNTAQIYTYGIKTLNVRLQPLKGVKN